MVKHCSHGLCKSDSRKQPDKKFALFVQPKGRNADLNRAKRWVHLCGRKGFTIENIERTTHICEDHFPENVDLDYRRNKDLEPYPVGYDRNERQVRPLVAEEPENIRVIRGTLEMVQKLAPFRCNTTVTKK